MLPVFLISVIKYFAGFCLLTLNLNDSAVVQDGLGAARRRGRVGQMVADCPSGGILMTMTMMIMMIGARNH